MPESLERIQESSTNIAVGLLIILLTWESFRPFFPFFRENLKVRVIHLVRNMAFGLFNAVMTSLGFILLWTWAIEWSENRGIGLLHQISWPIWLEFGVAVLLLDFWMYWWHRMNHRIPFLWRFHRVHHSDPNMDVTTANRFHFGEIMISSLLRVSVLILIGAQLWHLAIFEIFLFVVIQFHHANIGLPDWLDRSLRVFLVTPGMHKVHHSRYQPETDSNYTSLFSWWDRVFGSFRLSGEPRSINFGLDEFDSTKNQTIIGMALTPFGSTSSFDRDESE